MEPTAGRARAPRPGDDEFAAFYLHEHDRQVRRVCLLLGSEEVAHDIVHDAFVAIYRRWDDIDQPGPYLNRTVLNACRDHARHRRRHERALRLVEPVADHIVIAETLDDVLERLPFNQRAAIVLRYYAQLPVAEIADALGARPGSVGPWIDRGLKKMRKALS
jgi:RNA polymerase sigma factor (sigma-70 family)